MLWFWGVGECEFWGFECERENFIVEVLIMMVDVEFGVVLMVRMIIMSLMMSCNEFFFLFFFELWCLIFVRILFFIFFLMLKIFFFVFFVIFFSYGFLVFMCFLWWYLCW